MKRGLALVVTGFMWAAGEPDLEAGRDRQDRAALQKIASELGAAAEKNPNSAAAQCSFALAQSYLAEVALELRDRGQAKSAAETGIRAAEKAVALDPKNSEYQRVLGTLCG